MEVSAGICLVWNGWTVEQCLLGLESLDPAFISIKRLERTPAVEQLEHLKPLELMEQSLMA